MHEDGVGGGDVAAARHAERGEEKEERRGERIKRRRRKRNIKAKTEGLEERGKNTK